MSRNKCLCFLLLLTFAAVLVHGFHPGAEDAEVYLPNVKRALNPSLYPVGSEFFQPFAKLSLFPRLVAWSIELTHIPYDWAIFLWHLTTVFLFLYACRKTAAVLFDSEAGRWAGVISIAGLLTMPVAGTSLYIMDQYVTSRSLVTPLIMFAVYEAVESRWRKAALWLALAPVVHPIMAVFAFGYVVVLWWTRARENSRTVATAAALLPFGILQAPSQTYRDALSCRDYFFFSQWPWYSQLGAVAPILLFWYFSRIAKNRGMRKLQDVSTASAFFGLIFLLGSVVVTTSDRFLRLVEFQPLRYLHLQYILLLLTGGGLIGQFLLRRRTLLWAALFLPLFGGMWYSARQLFPDTRQVEWPGAPAHNGWIEAFLWIRNHTPVNAIFALDPHYLALPGEDVQGFRIISERSSLADAEKDSGMAEYFPALAEKWKQQVSAQQGWKDFQTADFARLRRDWGVTWVVLQRPAKVNLNCPFENSAVKVCKLE